MSYEETGKRIKSRRKELKISAATLAERLSLSKATIHRYENGDIKNIKMPVLEAMAETLKVNSLWLIGKSDMKDGTTTYDVCVVIDKLIGDLKVYENVVCNGDPLSQASRKHLLTALEIIRSALVVQ